jgi:hypothetical protein
VFGGGRRARGEGGSAVDEVGLEHRGEEEHVGDVVEAGVAARGAVLCGEGAEAGRAGERGEGRVVLEGGAEVEEAGGVAQRERAGVERAEVVEVLSRGEDLEGLDGRNGGARDLAGGVGERVERALALTEGDGVGDEAARGGVADVGDQAAGADQLGEVGDGPGLAGFDEEIVVKAVEIVFEDAGLLGEDRDQRAERVALLGVADAVDGGEQRVERGGVEAGWEGGVAHVRHAGHAVISTKASGRGSSVRSSAPRSAEGSASCGPAAVSSSRRWGVSPEM